MPKKGSISISFSDMQAERIMKYCKHHEINPTQFMNLTIREKEDLRKLAAKINPKKVPEQVRRYT